MHEDALYSELAARLPELLSPGQEQALWERVILDSGHAQEIFSVPRAARLAREAWMLAHEWAIAPRLQGFPASDDGRAFAHWAQRYERLTAHNGQTDRARVVEVLSPLLRETSIAKPSLLVAYGFDIRTPRQAALFAALERAGVEVRYGRAARCAAQARRISIASAKEEMRAAARWARSRLESRPDARIGVVVPDLDRSRKAVHRIFSEVMEPAGPLAAQGGRVLPFNVSLGEPLAAHPLVACAFLVLDLAARDVPYASASRLLRSPFISGAQAELAARAELDAALRSMAGVRIDLDTLRRMISRATSQDAPRRAPPCPVLSRLLEELARLSIRLSGTKSIAEWARTIVDLLKATGHPGERALDSVEYQTLAKWHEALSELAALERVCGRMSFREACSRLARIAADTLFQPEAPEVPVQILGVLESAELRFEHLWVMGLADEAWPLTARPNPFIALPLQRAAGVPEASAALSLELDRRITEGWLGAAAEVVISHALREEDRELLPSPLIAHLPQATIEELLLPQGETLARTMRRHSRMEVLGDAAPALAQANINAPIPVSGGTALFRDQAICPFRGFAVHRLGAERLEQIVPGLDARDRGTLLHSMLAKVWSLLETKAKLDAASARDLDALLAQAADTAINKLRRSRPDALEGRFAQLEKDRLIDLAREWLQREKERPAFQVAAIEEKHAVAFGGISVNAKLDRMDRIGTDGNGEPRYVVLDYKTGRISTAGWLGARPEEPQLPLYAVGRGGAHSVNGVAFARVKKGDTRFSGIANDEGLIPGVAGVANQRPVPGWPFRSWEELLALWRGEFEALGREFALGEARVAPKQGEKTCLRCELKGLCRINERASVPFEEEEPEGAT